MACTHLSRTALHAPPAAAGRGSAGLAPARVPLAAVVVVVSVAAAAVVVVVVVAMIASSSCHPRSLGLSG